MRITKGMLLYHEGRKQWGVVTKGGNSGHVMVNFNNQKVQPVKVLAKYLSKGYTEVRV